MAADRTRKRPRCAFVVIAAATMLLAASPAAGDAVQAAGEDIPQLRSGDAKYYADKALKRKFDASYRHGYAHKIKCGKRKSPTRIRCTPVLWLIGDSSYSGWTEIWLDYTPRGTLYWFYALRIKRLNEYCYIVRHHSRDACTKVYRVR